jgi:hypothetical protein
MRARFEAFQVGDLAVSSITEAELRFGADWDLIEFPFRPAQGSVTSIQA